MLFEDPFYMKCTEVYHAAWRDVHGLKWDAIHFQAATDDEVHWAAELRESVRHAAGLIDALKSTYQIKWQSTFRALSSSQSLYGSDRQEEILVAIRALQDAIWRTRALRDELMARVKARESRQQNEMLALIMAKLVNVEHRIASMEERRVEGHEDAVKQEEGDASERKKPQDKGPALSDGEKQLLATLKAPMARRPTLDELKTSFFWPAKTKSTDASPSVKEKQ